MDTKFIDQQYTLAYPEGIEYNWWHIARNKIIANELKKIATKTSRVIEVGCGRGIVVRHLREQGIDCHGVELGNPASPVLSNEYLKYGVKAEDLADNERKQYDILLLLDVIEHISDPLTFLNTLRSSFPYLKHIIITAPARPELWSNYDDHYGHFRRYTLESMASLCSENSLEISKLSYFFHILYFPTKLFLALGKLRPVEAKAPKTPMRIVHFILGYGNFIEYLFLPKKLFGTSILCITKTQ